jgi:hypothetical protein
VSSKIEKIFAQRKEDSNNEHLKVGIVSCINYQNFINVREVFMALKTFKHPFVILGGGNKIGADDYIKSLTLELDFGFVEYIPTHFKHTDYSYFPRMFHNGRFDLDNMNTRYKYLFFDCDILIILKNNNKKDVFIDKLIAYVKTSNSQKSILLI